MERHIFRTRIAEDLFLRHAVAVADFVDDDIDRQRIAAVERDLVFQCFHGKRQCDRLLFDAGYHDQAVESAFQLTDIRIDVACNVIDDFIRQIDTLLFSAVLQDDAADFIVRRGNRSDKAARETALQAVFELFNIRWRTVARHDDVLLLVEEFIERVEDFHLRRVPRAEELDIVNQKEVRISVLLAEVIRRMALDGIDQLIRERFTGHEKNGKLRLVFMDVIADRMQKMRLAKAGWAVNEERIHICIRQLWIDRSLCDGQGRRIRYVIAPAVDECLERVLLIDGI